MASFNARNATDFQSFYDKFILEDENVRATLKPIINQTLQKRVLVKEHQLDCSLNFSQVMLTHMNNLEDSIHANEINLVQMNAKTEHIKQVVSTILKKMNASLLNNVTGCGR